MTQKKNAVVFAIISTCILIITIVICAIANLRGRIETETRVLAPVIDTESMLITNQEEYIQTFFSNDAFDQIRLYFSFYGKENESSITVQLTDIETENILESWEIDNSSISEEPVKLKLKNERGEGTYRLVINGHNPNPETSIEICLQNNSVYSGELFVSGTLQDANIAIGLYKETNIGLYMFIGVLSASVACVLLAYVLLFVLKVDLWKISFALIMGFGCVYLAIFPSGCINDSWQHYITVYQYSNIFLGIERSAWGNVMMRADDCKEFLRLRKLGRSSNNAIDTSIDTYSEEFDEFSLWCSDKTLIDCGEKDLALEGGIASSVAYFPQTLGLTLGRIFSLGTIPCMYLARFIQLFTVATLISFSVKIVPTGKEILMLVALLPIFQQQITAFSYDGMAFGFAFLFISICMRFTVQKKRPFVIEYTVIIISIVGLCACRGGMYIFLLLLLILIPKEKLYTSSKIYLFCVGIFTVLSFFATSYFANTTLTNHSNALIWGSPFHHPVDVGLHFVSTIVESIDNLWGSLFGQKMGWGESIVPFFVTFGFTLMLLIVSLSNGDNTGVLNIKARVVYLIPVILLLGYCLGVMYFSAISRSTRWYIYGVQGRYLIPVLPLFFFQIQNNVIVTKRNIRPAIVYIFCIWEVVEIFYLMRTFIIR